MTENMYWLWLCSMKDVTRKYINKLLDEYETPENIYRAPDYEVASLLNDSIMAKWSADKDPGRIEKLMRALCEQNITFVYMGHPDYPKRFMEIPDPPPALYIKGRLRSSQHKNIAIVGSRNATPYGMECAQYFARKLAEKNVGVVSGLAVGIDGAAHQGALDVGGYTAGFIAGGIYSMYPRQNYHLYRRMEQSGAVISEYPPEIRPLGRLFPERNRLISGYSDGVLVVEAAKRSGTLITVDQGLEQGKNIYVIPGRITDVNSQGCNALIRDGARPVSCVEDIFEDMEWTDICDDNSSHKPELTEYSLAKSEKMVYSCLSLEAEYIDTIVGKTAMPVSAVLSALLALELKGYIKQPVKNYYMKRL